MFKAMASYDTIDETVREIAAYIIQNGLRFLDLYYKMCANGDVEGVLNNNDATLQLAFKCAKEIKKGLSNSKKLDTKFNLDPLDHDKIDLGKFGIDSDKGTNLAQIVRENYTQYKNDPANGDTKPTLAQLIDRSLAGVETIPESVRVEAWKKKPETGDELPAEISVAQPPATELHAAELPAAELPAAELPAAELPAAEHPAVSASQNTDQAQANIAPSGNDDIKQQATAILNDINSVDSPDPAVANLKNQAKDIHKGIMDGLVTDLGVLTGILTQIQKYGQPAATEEQVQEQGQGQVQGPEQVQGQVQGQGPEQVQGQVQGQGQRSVVTDSPSVNTGDSNQSATHSTVQQDETDSPQVVDIETDYPDVVEFIRRAQMSKSQGDHLIDMANYALNDPSGDRDTTELASAVRNFGPSSVDVIYDRLDMINPILGHKVTPYKPTRNIKFSKPTMMQSSRTRSVSTGLVTPEGFGTSINSNIWNKPVITEFGFPFLNISSEAITLLFKSKGETQQAAYKKFKSMLKTAVKTYGGIWKAIYKAPLDVLKQFANDPGTRCVANMLKVDGNDLLGSDFESTVTVTPIDYYSVDASYNQPTPVPREYLTSFYTVLDYTQADRATYLQYADGMTANDFVEATSQNNGIPPFYLLVPKSGSFSKCELKPTGVIGSFINLFSSAKNCILLKTYFNKRKGCFLMEKQVADALYADLQ